ncbi:PsbP-related protein [Candidatus Haliotispira prima]|uniref:PsbP-related protein n=1 Tax=Candidatus Haliotispira prima TaxID=3034016 RepID=A0ABY8MMM6_9SPIO|nr:PsbP-related protein [Candidatus Haliotispira prima]
MKKGNNIMKMLKLIGVLAVITSLVACGRKAEAGTPDSWESFMENNYSISYPGDWGVDQSGQMGTSFILLSPLSSGEDRFTENVNLIIQDLTGRNLDLDGYVELSEGQIKTVATDGNIIESTRMTTETLDYHKLIYAGQQSAFNLKFVQYYWLVQDQAYVLTFTCEEDQFDDYQATGEKILNSFNLTVGNKAQAGAEAQTEAGALDNWASLTEDDYSISYPEDWELDQSGQAGTSLILFSPLSSGEDQFKENVNLLIQDLTGNNLDLDGYVELSESQIKAVTTDGNIIESTRMTTETSEFHKVIYAMEQGVQNLKFEQYVWVLEDKAYVLTFTCEEDQFDDYQALGEQILNSFSVNKG